MKLLRDTLIYNRTIKLNLSLVYEALEKITEKEITAISNNFGAIILQKYRY